jgi:hypothetical protein
MISVSVAGQGYYLAVIAGTKFYSRRDREDISPGSLGIFCWLNPEVHGERCISATTVAD